jgi:hypothetical protein
MPNPTKAGTLSRPARSTVEIIQQMKEAGEPIKLAICGKVDLVIQDETSFEHLLDLIDRVETIEGIRVGLEEMKAGKGRPAEELFEELRQEYGMPGDA